ncbi:MAG: polysaccharide biosynthesis tyrosine autokinase, partial [Candidatus Omnitrophica bacterium]|nr:polysaccharide biosynthesis tyrosine autokinase [Candidatus Omnitrophota bacterium]
MKPKEAELHFNDYMFIIKKRMIVLVIFFFLTVFVTAVISYMMTPIYRATVTLFVDMESPNVLTTTGSFALENTDYYAYKEYLQSQKELIKSRNIAKQVFEEFALDQKDRYLNAEDPLEEFIKNIQVETVRDTRLMLLSVDDEDPKEAAAVANRIAEIYVTRNLSYITKIEILNLLKNEYLKLESRLSEYNKIYKHKHPKMIRLKREMAQVAERIQKEMARKGNYDLTSLSQEELDSEEGNFLLAGFKANNITIQDPAEPPVEPVMPKKRLNILLAVVVGFFGGLGLLFFAEYLDDTVKSVEDVERVVEWPFLGHIPEVKRRMPLIKLEKDKFVHKRPKDPIAEAYRVIRTSVLFSATEEQPVKTIVVASPGPQEGKTMTLCNLGITMAKNQSKVLLVDADMRKPRLHNIFNNKKNDVGLSSFLSGKAKFSEIVKPTEIEGLFFIGGGPYPPNPSELLTSRKMDEFLNLVGKEYDFILFDTPPIAVVTDAIILSKVVSGVILVVENGKTS